MYGYFEPPWILPRGLVVSMSDYALRGPGSIPGWAHIKHCFVFSSFFSVIMLNYFKQVLLNYINDSLTFYIGLSSKSVGMGLNLALLKDNLVW